MLPYFRKHIKTVIWVIVVSFVAWGAGTIATSQGKSSSYAGSVFGEKISLKEFQTLVRFYEIMAENNRRNAQIQTQSPPAKTLNAPSKKELPSPKKEAPIEQTQSESPAEPETPSVSILQGLAWQTIVISREATRENVRVSDLEVAEEIQRMFGGPGSFNSAYYQKWVQSQFRTQPRDFEETVREYLTVDKMREKVLAGIEPKDRMTKWYEWLGPVMNRSKLEDYTQMQSAAAD